MTIKRVRYTLENVKNNRFYQMPKFLFEGEFKEMSNDARVLYSLLRDRHELSIKNNWVNENNEVYLIFTREDMAQLLGCSQPTLRKSIKQLTNLGLMEEERQGLNKPNIIYLTAVSIENTWNERNFQSRGKESFIQEGKNLSPNDTDFSDTDFSDTIYQSPCDSKEKERQNETTTNEFQDILYNSGLYEFEEKYSSAIEQSLRLLYFSNKPLVIDNMSVPPSQVKKDLERLRWKHLDLALRDFKNQAEMQEIRYPAGYLSRCIYNAIFQSDLKLEAELRYNGSI